VEARVNPKEKIIQTLTFYREEAFYEYLDRLLASQGYVLVETCPLKKEKKPRQLAFSAREEKPYPVA